MEPVSVVGPPAASVGSRRPVSSPREVLRTPRRCQGRATFSTATSRRDVLSTRLLEDASPEFPTPPRCIVAPRPSLPPGAHAETTPTRGDIGAGRAPRHYET
jgi:hypothetical protein